MDKDEKREPLKRTIFTKRRWAMSFDPPTSVPVGDNKYCKSWNGVMTCNSGNGIAELMDYNVDNNMTGSENILSTSLPENSAENENHDRYDETSSNKSSTSSATQNASDITHLELRMRIRRSDDENSFLREELLRIEELAALHERQVRSMQKNLERMRNKCELLEQENDEQKELISRIEDEKNGWQVALQKIEKDCHAEVNKLEIEKKTTSITMERLNKEKHDCLKQLSTCRMKLEKKSNEYEIMKDKLHELTEVNMDLQVYYEQKIRELQDKIDIFKNENSKSLELDSSDFSKNSSTGAFPTLPVINEDSSSEGPQLLYSEQKVDVQDSLFTELKASGFPLGEEKCKSKIQQLQNEMEWYDTEFDSAIQHIEKITEDLRRHRGLQIPCEKYHDSGDGFQCETASSVNVFFQKIALLSDAVSEVLCENITCNSSSQVSTDPVSTRTEEFQILSFRDWLDRKSGLIADNSSFGSERGQSTVNFQFQPCAPKVEFAIPLCGENSERCQQKNDLGSLLARYSTERPIEKASLNENASEFPSVKDIEPSMSPDLKAEIEPKIESSKIFKDHTDESTNVPRTTKDSKNEKNENLSVKEYKSNCEALLCFSPSSSKEKYFTIGVSDNSTSPTEMGDKIVPRRKLSVFQRSFDIDTVFETSQDDIISESHILSERSTSGNTLSCPRDDLIGNIVTNNELNGCPTSGYYRTNVYNSPASDSSCSPSPNKLSNCHEEDTPAGFARSVKKNSGERVVIAPSKLNFLFGITEDMDDLEGNSVGVSVFGKTNDKTEISGESNVQKSEVVPGNASTADTTTCSLNDDHTFQELGVTNTLNETPIVYLSDVPIAASTAIKPVMSSGEDSSDGSESDRLEVIGTNSDYGIQNHNRKPVQLFERPESKSKEQCVESMENNWMSDATYNVFRNNNNKSLSRNVTIRRSMSAGEGIDCNTGDNGNKSYCHTCESSQLQQENEEVDNIMKKREPQITAFPSVSDEFLQESGIAVLSVGDDNEMINLPEEELERKFLAFSVGLCTDRVTLSRRRFISLRQRDQTEHDLAAEMFKMQLDIQALAPLCLDSETVERIERARNQIEIIAKCAHKVSCAAETLGAIQQEYRISRAVYLADRYLKVLRTRCEKLAADLGESKRILMENNIMINENISESSEELSSALRYRGLPNATNRTMVARRRASIATIFRPLVNFQEGSKDNGRQRNSVSGRVTLRRPSFSSEAQKWEVETVNRTESTNSLGEVREIFEQAESRRTSREENNNFIRPQSVTWEGDHPVVWVNNVKEQIMESLPDEENLLQETRPGGTMLTMTSVPSNFVPWRMMIWCIIIAFFIGFYVKHVVSSDYSLMCAKPPFKWWSIEEILGRQVVMKNTAPRPV